MTTCDVVVLGLGPGGEAVATKLARAGLDVVAVDQRLVGGECPYYGCVPSKMMIHAALPIAEARRLPGVAEVRPDWSAVARRIRDEATDDWDDAVAVKRLEDAGVRFVRGHGRLTGPGRVEVEGTTYDATRGVVLNTGTEPAVPPVDGLADTPYWTNRDAVQVTDLPASLIVVGGGAIGCELAQVFARFGVEVSVVEVADRLLANEEPEAGRVVAEAFAAEGIRVRTGAEIASVSHAEGTFTVDLGEERLTADKLLVAAGRKPNLDRIGLDSVGLDPSVRSLEVDDHLRAGERLWAVGDITGKGAFTHVSMYQADVAVRALLEQEGPWADYRAVPRVTFTDPEVGAVGMTEEQARAAGLEVRAATGDLGARGWIAERDGVVKLVADARRGVLVGGTVAGPAGGEVLSMLATAVHAEVPVATLRSMVYAYPTFHRAVETVLGDLGL
ncbi:MAG TPA: NAD(P)/FAD-dependent oxidoreductase [Marmoricola sp.]|nr:NAD(P)/FAD-dependent oxidoreductase [Marmoricola sp.]